MRIRRTSRLILLDEANRVLLFKVADTAVFRPEEPSLISYWMTPRGSLESGESHTSAARRELWEESGMTGIELGPWVAVCEPLLNWAGELLQAHDRFYLARTRSPAVSLANLNAAEGNVYRAHRWWDIAELRASGERVVPPGLVDLLTGICAGNMPSRPVRLE